MIGIVCLCKTLGPGIDVSEARSDEDEWYMNNVGRTVSLACFQDLCD